MKQLQNNFTTPEQSKRLLDLGMPADSADCLIYEKPYYTIHVRRKGKRPHSHNKGVPCWSVGRLIEILQMLDLYFELDSENTIIESLLSFLLQEESLDFSKLEE